MSIGRRARRDADHREGLPAGLPLDPDVDPAEDALHRASAPPTTRWPRLRAGFLVAVVIGGCLGGGLRYAVTTAWPEPAYGFPTATLVVNLAGAFVLSVLIVLVAALPQGSRLASYARPLLGTGFCGGLTTFSAVVVSTDRLLAHGDVGTGVAYLAASFVGGFAAAVAGFVLARAARRRFLVPGTAS